MRDGIRQPGHLRSMQAVRQSCLAATMALILASSAWAGSDDSTVFRDGMEEYLALRGRASIENTPLANASVQARWGHRLETTTADGDGQYTLLLPDLSGFDAPLEITARGQATQSSVEMASYPGSIGQLLAVAGNDHSLSADDLAELDLTPYSTALAKLLQDAVAPASLVDEDMLNRAARSAATQLTELYPAALALMTGQIELPAGAETSYAALIDPQALALVVAALRALEPADALDLYDRAQQIPRESNVPQGLQFGSYVSFGSLSSTAGEAFRLMPDGNGAYWNMSGRRDIVWQEVGSELHVTATDAGALSSFESYRYVGNQQVRSVDSTIGIQLRGFRGPLGRTLVAVGVSRRRTYPDNPEILAEEFAYPAVAPGLAIVAMEGQTDIMFDIAPGTRFALPMYSGGAIPSGSVQPFYVEVHRFIDAQTGTTERTQTAFAWGLDADGRLEINYADGSQARFTRASDEGGRDYGSALAILRSSDQVERFYGSLAVRVADDAFSHDNLIGSYSAISFFNPMSAILEPLEAFQILQFDAGGTGIGFGAQMVWSIDDEGRLLADRLIPPDLTPYNRRGWQLLRRDGARHLLLENFHFDTEDYIADPIDFSEPTGRLLVHMKQ